MLLLQVYWVYPQTCIKYTPSHIWEGTDPFRSTLYYTRLWVSSYHTENTPSVQIPFAFKTPPDSCQSKGLRTYIAAVLLMDQGESLNIHVHVWTTGFGKAETCFAI